LKLHVRTSTYYQQYRSQAKYIDFLEGAAQESELMRLNLEAKLQMETQEKDRLKNLNIKLLQMYSEHRLEIFSQAEGKGIYHWTL